MCETIIRYEIQFNNEVKITDHNFHNFDSDHEFLWLNKFTGYGTILNQSKWTKLLIYTFYIVNR